MTESRGRFGSRAHGLSDLAILMFCCRKEGGKGECSDTWCLEICDMSSGCGEYPIRSSYTYGEGFAKSLFKWLCWLREAWD